MKSSGFDELSETTQFVLTCFGVVFMVALLAYGTVSGVLALGNTVEEADAKQRAGMVQRCHAAGGEIKWLLTNRYHAETCVRDGAPIAWDARYSYIPPAKAAK